MDVEPDSDPEADAVASSKQNSNPTVSDINQVEQSLSHSAYNMFVKANYLHAVDVIKALEAVRAFSIDLF